MNSLFSKATLRGAVRRDVTFFAVAAVAVALLALLSQLSPTVTDEDSTDRNSFASVRFVFSSENIRKFSGAVMPGMTIADALQIASSTGHFPLMMNDEGRPTAVDGVGGTWRIFHNGDLVVSPATSVPVSSGDEIEVVVSDSQ